MYNVDTNTNVYFARLLCFRFYFWFCIEYYFSIKTTCSPSFSLFFFCCCFIGFISPEKKRKKIKLKNETQSTEFLYLTLGDVLLFFCSAYYYCYYYCFCCCCCCCCCCIVSALLLLFCDVFPFNPVAFSYKSETMTFQSILVLLYVYKYM